MRPAVHQPQARRGFGVILITHNVNHAFPVGDRFTILDRGRAKGTFDRGQITAAEMLEQMAGGAELAYLRHELEDVAPGATEPPIPPPGPAPA